MKAYFLIFLGVSFWAGNFIIGRYLKDDFSPVELNTLRWIFVFLFISPYILVRKKIIINHIKNNFFILFGLAILSVTLFNTILYYGLSETESINALVINLIIPIFVLLLSSIFLKTSIKVLHLVGILFSIIGVLIIISKANIELLLNLTFNFGDIFIIIGAFVWSLYSILINFKPQNINDFDYFSIIVLLGTVVLIIAYLLFGFSFYKSLETTITHIYPLIYISLFASIASFCFWHYGIETIGSNKTSQFTYLMPLVGALIAYVFLDEKLELFHLIGMIFIATGIYISLFLANKNKRN